jgi:UDPglucose 6-dehydrogenase
MPILQPASAPAPADTNHDLTVEWRIVAGNGTENLSSEDSDNVFSNRAVRLSPPILGPSAVAKTLHHHILGGPNMARIFIIGSGVVGTATGSGFLEGGHDVTFIDIATARLEALSAQGKDVSPTINLNRESPAFIFLTLPTPNIGHHYDLSAFESGVRSVGRALKTAGPGHVVVVRSTVPPGTTERVVQPILEEESGKTVGAGFTVASNPEFLRAASAAEDFRWPWMTVIASRNKRTQERLQALLAPFGGEQRIFDDPAVAEMIKCSHNIFNAAKISFWNEMWQVCQALGIDHDDVASTVARSSEGSFRQTYGIRGGAPYGGVCLPKDTQGFLGFARERGVPMPLLHAVVRVNDSMISGVERELADATGRLELPGAEVPTIRVDDLVTSSNGSGAAGSVDRADG